MNFNANFNDSGKRVGKSPDYVVNRENFARRTINLNTLSFLFNTIIVSKRITCVFFAILCRQLLAAEEVGRKLRNPARHLVFETEFYRHETYNNASPCFPKYHDRLSTSFPVEGDFV